MRDTGSPPRSAGRHAGAPLLRMRGVCKSFGAGPVLDRVDFELSPGEVHVLMGENGAGKSTLMKILSGSYRADAGEIHVDGNPVRIDGPADARRRGISMIYQEFNLVPGLTVAENIFLGRLPLRGRRWVDWPRLFAAAAEALRFAGVGVDPRAKVKALSVAEQQLVEIAKALSERARILVMDEPTAALTARETERLFEVVAELRRQGMAIVWISHRMDEIFRIGDRISVLRDGRLVDARPARDWTVPQVIAAMVGRELTEMFPKREVPLGAPVLVARGVGDGRRVRDVSFEVRQGELLAVTGLVGAGRTELVRALFGADGPPAGEIALRGRPLRLRGPRDAIAAGIGFVPEDRARQGIVPAMSVLHNISLARLPALIRRGPAAWLRLIDHARRRSLAQDLVGRLRIAARGLGQQVRSLSGGNQQKVVLARWLATDADVLILDEPTRGIDVATKAEIHRLMGDFVAGGRSVVFVSSELPEVLGLADRVLVMREGRAAALLERAAATQERITAFAFGSQPGDASAGQPAAAAGGVGG